MNQTYFNLDFDGFIYPSFPQSVKAIIEWFCSREDIIEGLVGMSGTAATANEVKEAFKQVTPIIIQHDPRKLYEFFDDKGIHISVGTHPDTTSIFVAHNSIDNHSITANSRKDVELKAFIEAFSILEKRLQDEGAQGSISKKGGE